jgi:hypothetical protein
MEYFNALHGTSVVEMSSLKGENRKGSGNIEFLMLNGFIKLGSLKISCDNNRFIGNVKC